MTNDQPEATAPGPFRWPTYLQRSSDPLFFLNRQRRLLFANRAWEALTGISFRDVRGLVCKRHPRAPDLGMPEALQHALAPTAEVLEGKPARARRLIPAMVAPETGQPEAVAPGRWWDIAFFPFAGEAGLLGILGKITPLPREGIFEHQPVPEKIIDLRERLVQRLGLEDMPSELPAMRRLSVQMRLAGQTHVPVLLVGERGTGKHWLARSIHQHSSRREGPFAAVDCARLPPRALAEVLFAEGGMGRRLHLGSLYLHQPASLPGELQERLGQLIQAWSQDENPQGPRLLAGSTGDPQDEVRQGKLLPELYCLLSPLVITLPSLRERLQDLPWLTKKLLERAVGAAGRDLAGLSDEAMAVLRSYSWPGNVAELFQVLVDACRRAKGERIEAGDLPFHVRSGPAPAPRGLPLDSLLEQVERRLIVLALRQAKNNKTEAAQLLSIWRQRLIRRMEALGIENTP